MANRLLRSFALVTALFAGGTLFLPAQASAMIPPVPETSDNAAPGESQSPPASAIVEIDGRFVTVNLSITRVVGGLPRAVQSPSTGVDVHLVVNDGAPLPPRLDAVGVRFEKLRGVRRFFFTPVNPVSFTTFEEGTTDEFEEDSLSFFGDMSERPIVQSLRATVRLELQGEVIRVPLGIVRVNTVFVR